MNDYITDVQKETMTSYPITISDETIDLSSIMGLHNEIVGEMQEEGSGEKKEKDGVFADYRELETSERLSSQRCGK